MQFKDLAKSNIKLAAHNNLKNHDSTNIKHKRSHETFYAN